MTSDWPRPTEPNLSTESLRRDAEAAVAARRELGPEYGSAVDQAEVTTQRQRFVLAIISLGVGVPITAISATQVDPLRRG